MMDINALSETSGVSVRTLRKLDKLGVLKVSADKNPILTSAKANLKKGNALTALQQWYLLRHPKEADALEKYSYQIDDMLQDLGPVTDEAAPWQTVGSRIELAAQRDVKAIEDVTTWIAELIDTAPAFNRGKTCFHAYIAVRMLDNIPVASRDYLAGKINACMWQCRQHERLAGYWKLDEKNRTVYFRPAKKTLDL